MYLYNITYIVEDVSATEWLNWVNNTHIPEIIATEKFVSHRLLTVVDSPNEGITFCSQFIAETEADVKNYKANFEENLQAEMHGKFPNKFVLFSTLMQFIS